MKFDNTNRMSLTCKLRIRLDISFSSQLSLKISFEKIANRQQNSRQKHFSKSLPDEQKLKYIFFCKNRDYLEYLVGGAKIFLLFIH